MVSSAFDGLNRIRQHQLVYKALKEELQSEAIRFGSTPQRQTDSATRRPTHGCSDQTRIETLIQPSFRLHEGHQLMPVRLLQQRRSDPQCPWHRF